MRNLAEMGLLKNRSAFICRPTPEEALKWGDSLDKLLAHKCKFSTSFKADVSACFCCFVFVFVLPQSHSQKLQLVLVSARVFLDLEALLRIY